MRPISKELSVVWRWKHHGNTDPLTAAVKHMQGVFFVDSLLMVWYGILAADLK